MFFCYMLIESQPPETVKYSLENPIHKNQIHERMI